MNDVVKSCNCIPCVHPFIFCSVFLVVYSVQRLYPRIKNVTAAAAETYANVSWEYEGPAHESVYVEYGVAGSKKTFP